MWPLFACGAWVSFGAKKGDGDIYDYFDADS